MRLKYKILLAIITVGIGICLMTYQSYALWVATYTGGENIVNVGCFEIEFTEQTSSIGLNNTYPVSDTKGLTTEPYTFTIKNTCTIDAAYDVTLNTLTTNTMKKEWLKYAIQESTETKPTTGINLGTNNNYNTATEELQIANLDESIIIVSGELKEEESITYNLYLWMDETTGNEAMNTRFEGSVNIITSAVKIVTAADTILAKGETEELAYDGTADNNLRYIGSNPNNYVSFNNELWRIIGVFNNIDDGTGKKETRLKIIRGESIGKYSWDNKASGIGSSDDEYGSNDWSDSALQIVLNEGSYWNRTSGECPYGQNGATTSCDFTNTGLTEEAKSMISDAIWNLGGLPASSRIPSSFYTSERGTTVYSGGSTEWIGKIGLMYPSDYGYATSGGSTTDRNTCLNTELYDWRYLGVSDCKNNDWLYDSSNDQWTLTPSSGFPTSVFFAYMSGGVDDGAIVALDTDNVVVPALYLSSNVKISGGEGTRDLPFTLSL